MKHFLLIVGFCAAPVWSQATQPSPQELSRLPGMLRAELEAAGEPLIIADSVPQLVTFAVQDDFLVAGTSLRVPSRHARVLVKGLPGVVRIVCYSPDQPDPAASSFSVSQRDLTNPQAGEVITTISAVAGRLNLSRDAELGDGATSSIQLVQDPPPLAGELPDDDPVRFLVTQTPVDPRRPTVNIKASARSFTELRRRHGDSVDTYLRPIIRDFGQEREVFGVADAIAWQVLGGNYSADADAVAAVEKIVVRLDAEEFRQRVAAMSELRALGQRAALVLLRLDRNRFSLQQNSAIDTFLADFAPLADDQSRSLATDISFLLDVLYTNDVALRKLALSQLERVAGRALSLDENGSPSQRAEQIAGFRRALKPSTQPTTQPG